MDKNPWKKFKIFSPPPQNKINKCRLNQLEYKYQNITLILVYDACFPRKQSSIVYCTILFFNSVFDKVCEFFVKKIWFLICFENRAWLPWIKQMICSFMAYIFIIAVIVGLTISKTQEIKDKKENFYKTRDQKILPFMLNHHNRN
jgi:hypothetical protein